MVAAHPADGVSLGGHTAGELTLGESEGFQQVLAGEDIAAAVGDAVIHFLGVFGQVAPEDADVVDAPVAFGDGGFRFGFRGRFRFRHSRGCGVRGGGGQPGGGFAGDDDFGEGGRGCHIADGKLPQGGDDRAGVTLNCQSNLNHSLTSRGASSGDKSSILIPLVNIFCQNWRRSIWGEPAAPRRAEARLALLCFRYGADVGIARRGRRAAFLFRWLGRRSDSPQ